MHDYKGQNGHQIYHDKHIYSYEAKTHHYNYANRLNHAADLNMFPPPGLIQQFAEGFE